MRTTNLLLLFLTAFFPLRHPKILLLSLLLCLPNMFQMAMAQARQPVVFIGYYSQSGNTQAMAEAVAKGARGVTGVSVVLKKLEEAQPADVLSADAIILGSPVYNANVAPPVQAFINQWPFEGAPLKNKLGAAFVTAGGISVGEELSMLSMLQSMLVFGMMVVGGETAESAFGASAITGEAPFDTGQVAPQFLAKGEALGKRVANLALQLAK